MKKIGLIALALFFCLAIPSSMMAQEKQLNKALKKEYKKKMQAYEKEGWKIFGTSRTLDVSLLSHYQKLNEDGITEAYGTTISSSKNIAKDKLLMSACVTYAAKNGSKIKGRIVDDMGSIVSTEEMAEFDHFYAAYENAIQTEIKGELRQSYSIYRPVKIDGKDAFEFETYYIVDEAEASKARIRAFQNAARESAVAQKYAEKVSEFIKEAFNPMED